MAAVKGAFGIPGSKLLGSGMMGSGNMMQFRNTEFWDDGVMECQIDARSQDALFWDARFKNVWFQLSFRGQILE